MRKLLSFRLILAALVVPVSALAQGVAPGAEDEALSRFRAGVEQIRAEVLRPGERVAGWDRGGADPDADLRVLGADRYYQLSRGADGTGVTILTDRPIGDFAPASWRVVDSYGQIGERLDQPQVDFHPISERYVIASRTSSWRHNDAGCMRGPSHALLYEIPGAPQGPDDEAMPIMFRMLILATEGQTVCARADGNRETGYRLRYFLPDGRALPMLSINDVLLSIVPAAPIDTLVRGVPMRRTTTG